MSIIVLLLPTIMAKYMRAGVVWIPSGSGGNPQQK